MREKILFILFYRFFHLYFDCLQYGRNFSVLSICLWYNLIMKILLMAINSKFIHRNLAMDQLHAICKSKDIQSTLFEGNISQSVRDILLSCHFEDFDMVFFSVYLWNEAIVRELAVDMKSIRPKIRLFAGGPQAYSCPDDFFPYFDGIAMGDGEAPFLSILTSPDDPQKWFHVSTAHNIEPLYFEKNLDSFPSLPKISENQILYYESSRGCPYRCSYCLSAGTPLVLRSLSRVRKDLTYLTKAKVKLVKLVDRSFNAHLERALEIIDIIKELDNGVTTFHLELTPIGLHRDLLASLVQAREGLFRYEIGIQSTNDLVNLQVARPFKKESYWASLVAFMKEAPGQKHLDLLVGIPGSNMENIKKSLDELGALRPDELQLGFLKVLPGTPLGKTAEELGIVSGSRPPYEVLETPDLSFQEIKLLKKMERNMDLFHMDSIPFTLDALLRSHSTFDLYKIMAEELPDLKRATFSRRLKSLESCFPSELIRECLELDYLRKKRSPRSLFYPERFKGYKDGKAIYEGYYDGNKLLDNPIEIRIDQQKWHIDFTSGGR